MPKAGLKGPPKRVIIAGGRGVNDYDMLEEAMNKVYEQYPSISTVNSGKASGADTLGEKWAASKDIDIAEFPAHWKPGRKDAGYKRNVRMAEKADMLVAFWDGRSRGTGHMVEIARKKGLPFIIIDTRTGKRTSEFKKLPTSAKEERIQAGAWMEENDYKLASEPKSLLDK